MKKVLLILMALLLLLSSVAGAEQAKAWSLLVPLHNNAYELVNIIKNNDKFYIVGVELNNASIGYSYSEKNDVYEIQMDDEIHKAQIVNDKLFYQLLPDNATIMLSAVEDYDPLYSTMDGSFNIDALKAKEDSSMSYDELVSLQNELTKEIMSRPEWKEVEVPAGQYTIGVDIPAGWYSMKPKSKWDSVYLRWYPNPDNDYWDYLRTDDIARFELKEGMRIYLEQTTIFAPARSLGF